jgi:hypothetical protein
MTVRYLSAEGRNTDDFGISFTKREGEIVYDAKTAMGPWACMTEDSYEIYGLARLGTGFGQKYRRDKAGQLHKVEG